MHFSSGGSALSGLSPGTRDTMDPIAELLSQLSSVRSRAAAAQNVSSQLQQLEMQLQSTRYSYVANYSKYLYIIITIKYVHRNTYIANDSKYRTTVELIRQCMLTFLMWIYPFLFPCIHLKKVNFL